MQFWIWLSSKLPTLNLTYYDVFVNYYENCVNSVSLSNLFKWLSGSNLRDASTQTTLLESLNSLERLWCDFYCYLFWCEQHFHFMINVIYLALCDSFTSSMVDSIIISIKFLLLISLFIFVRGGIPRYRFDHLTKMGWIKFLSLVLASALVEILLIWWF